MDIPCDRLIVSVTSKTRHVRDTGLRTSPRRLRPELYIAAFAVFDFPNSE